MSLSTSLSRLTDEQTAALAAYDRSVSLAAGAGCGKTFVLTERFLSYLDPRIFEPEAELQELVAITFTDAAAREMRERIRGRCAQRLQEADTGEVKTAWQRLLRSMDDAKISTIHSFCTTLLRNHAAEAHLDPRFELLDPAAAELLRLQTLDDRLRELLMASDERLIQLATRFGLSKLRNDVARLMEKNPWPTIERWHSATSDELVAVWREYYAEKVIRESVATFVASDPLSELRQICQAAEVTKEDLPGHLQSILQVIGELSTSAEPAASLDQLRQLARVQGVCRKADWVDEKEFDCFKNTCKAVRDLIDKSIILKPIEEEALLEAATVGLDLLHVVADVAEIYDSVKQEQGVLEFDDLLIRAHRLLVDPQHAALQKRITGNARLLMVDEFQDTDPLQVAIVKALCGNDWSQQGLFVVGDQKQSIYRFRGAEPRVSSELRATLPAESRLSLTTNFRSQPAILDFVNALFHGAFVEEYEPLRPNRPQLTETPAVEFLWAEAVPSNSRTPSQQGTTKQSRAHEADLIARRLAELLGSEKPLVVDPGAANAAGPRPLQLGDIAILMRSLSDVPIYEEALRRHGLDYYLTGGRAFYAQQEIYDILHLLRSVASAADELSLAGALRSPFFALQDETLFWLVEEHGSLNAGLFAPELPSQLTADERSKASRAATILRDLRDQKDRLLVAQLLNAAFRKTGYDAALLSEFLGDRKLANVRKLVEHARVLDRTRPGDLSAMITQLSEFVVRDPKEPLAATRSEGNVIRIMTIHNAKGLEFPLVVVPDLERKNMPGTHLPVCDPELGPLVPMDDKTKTVGWDMHHVLEQEQDLEERKRLLYVACTRAADYLLLSSSVKDLAKPQSDWMRLLGKRFDLASGQFRGSLPEDYEFPEVRVTTSPPKVDQKTAGKSQGKQLGKLLEKTRKLAAAGTGDLPETMRPIAVDLQSRRRFSFSRLSGQLTSVSSSQNAPERTDGQLDSGLDPLGFGTLVHSVLERVNFSGDDNLAQLCRHLAPQHLQTNSEEAAAEAAQLVAGFLESDRAAKLAGARTIRREVEFLLPWPAGDGKRYLQGFIDCLYQDAAGDWHLVDYKSNQVDAAGVHSAAQPYELQMFIYSRACEQALGVAPVERVLHFLRPQAETSFTWDDAAQAEMTAQLNQAIQTQIQPLA